MYGYSAKDILYGAWLGTTYQNGPSTSDVSCSMMLAAFVRGKTLVNNQLLELRLMQFEWLLSAIPENQRDKLSGI